MLKKLICFQILSSAAAPYYLSVWNNVLVLASNPPEYLVFNVIFMCDMMWRDVVWCHKVPLLKSGLLMRQFKSSVDLFDFQDLLHA